MEPMPYNQLNDQEMLGLCIYREARGEGMLGKQGVGCVVRNRIAANKFFGHDWRSVILKPYQFSSFNSTDVNSVKWPDDDEADWLDCLDAASQVINGSDDPTFGALYYFSPPLTEAPHAWGPVMITVKVGRLTFCKPVTMAETVVHANDL